MATSSSQKAHSKVMPHRQFINKLVFFTLLLGVLVAASAQTSNNAEIRETIRRLYELVNARNYEALSEVVSRSFLDEMNAFHESLVQRFPDARIDVAEMVVGDGRVVVLEKISGTHQGQHGNLAATGKTAVWDAVIVYNVFNGKIQGVQYYLWDNIRLYEQLGVLPEELRE